MNNPKYQQASFLADDQPPLAVSHGVAWNLDDPAQPAKLKNGKKEPGRANRALRAYLQLGPTRSPALLLAHLAAKNQSNLGLRQIQTWTNHYAWDERARHYDELGRQRQRQQDAERQRSILQRGVAITLERVEELKQMYARLKQDMLREERVWLVEVKYQRVDKDTIERVENLRFNAALFNQARGALADLARETGGRPLRTEISSAPSISASPSALLDGFSELSKEELDNLEKVMRKIGLDHELFP
jgi:hypothetical protein